MAAPGPVRPAADRTGPCRGTGAGHGRRAGPRVRRGRNGGLSRADRVRGPLRLGAEVIGEVIGGHRRGRQTSTWPAARPPLARCDSRSRNAVPFSASGSMPGLAQQCGQPVRRQLSLGPLGLSLGRLGPSRRAFSHAEKQVTGSANSTPADLLRSAEAATGCRLSQGHAVVGGSGCRRWRGRTATDPAAAGRVRCRSSAAGQCGADGL